MHILKFAAIVKNPILITAPGIVIRGNLRKEADQVRDLLPGG